MKIGCHVGKAHGAGNWEASDQQTVRNWRPPSQQPSRNWILPTTTWTLKLSEKALALADILVAALLSSLNQRTHPATLTFLTHRNLHNIVDPGTPGVRTGRVLLNKSILLYSIIHVFSLLHEFLTNMFLSLAYLIVRTQYIIHRTYKYVSFNFSVIGKAFSGPTVGWFVVEFWGSQKLNKQSFDCAGGQHA